MKESVFICLLLSAVTAFNDLSSASVSDASASASKTINTVKDALDIVSELNQIRNSRKGSGEPRTRRHSDLSAASVANASASASETVNTVKNLLDIISELDQIRNSRKESGKPRTRRHSDLSSASVANASASASDTINTVKNAIDIKNELNQIRKGMKGSGKPRTRRHSDLSAASVANASASASETINTVKNTMDIISELDQIRKGMRGSDKPRTRRHSDLSSASVANASASASDTINTVKNAIDIKNELNQIRKGTKGSGKPRTRRYSESLGADATSTVNKITAGIGAFLKTYFYQPIAHGNFQESTIRGYTMFEIPEGRFVFATLNGELNQSFKSIMERRPRTGDIISCRIPSSRMAEHYMMVINSKIAEVGVMGGKTSHNGIISIDSYRKLNYYNSTECLHHENRIILRAEKLDEERGDDKETEVRYNQILRRIQCTVEGKGSGKFNYDLMSCNCQDVVLYWSYGYMENNCVAAFFNGCEKFLENTLFQVAGYVDVNGELEKRDEVGEIVFGHFS